MTTSLSHMKKLILLCLVVGICSACIGQDDGYKEPGPASQAYHEYRAYSTVPPYGLQRVRQLIKAETVRREDPDSDDAGTDSLPEKLYETLLLREKFTYNMIYGESYSQNCDAFLAVADEEKKIYGNIPDVMGDQSWSARQIGFFKDNRDSVIALMTESIGGYAPFYASASYKKLYGGGHPYDASLTYNAANEALIIQRATDFYNSLAH
jgi:hypothetical protein